MINIKGTKLKCREDIELIQNYDKAISDDTQVWDCHHRLGTVIPKKKLLEMDLYDNRPALELIFIPHSEHTRLHNHNHQSGMYGKKHSEKSKQKMCESKKGELNGMYGNHHSEEARKKQSEAAKRRWLKYHTEQELNNHR